MAKSSVLRCFIAISIIAMPSISQAGFYSCYWRDLDVYFHIFEVRDDNYDIKNIAALSGDLQNQGHELFL